MLVVSGYSNIRKITETFRKVIYRGRRDSDEKDVILITLNTDHPTIEEITLLSHEYSILKELHLPNVIEAYEMISADDAYILVEEDIKGISLRTFMNDYNVTLDDFFTIAIQVVQCVGQLHQHNIIHKDINPDNIIINPNDMVVRIIDFSHSTHLSQEITEVSNKLEGTLAYIAPEQTGRMNIPTDYRCDFYSLGIMFYEILAKKLPFYAEDAVEFVHCHLAMTAPLLDKLDPEIPEMVSKIVEKLMAKSAADRYVSAEGLQSDLERCQKEWKEKNRIESFELGLEEDHHHLNISQRLYGRESEIEQLLEAYERASNGFVELFLISGHSGIGKTALVNEVHKPMASKRGVFITGEFDQLGRSVPYTALIDAFKEYVTRLLSDSKEVVEQARIKILEAVGNSGQVLIDVFPELVAIIGEQPKLEEKSYIEAKNRLTYFFQKFMRAIASPERPLVIFIDDLQWVDNASLLLIETMLTDDELRNVLFIGAYRENEVTSDHPFIKLVDKLSEGKLKINQVELKPLTIENYFDFIQDSLNLKKSEVSKLANILFQKTKGNPFFAKELLRAIYLEKALVYSQAKRRWVWSIEKINKLGIADDAAEFMVNEITKLKPEVQSLLTVAACIGHTFDLKTVALISDYSTTHLIQLMMNALESGLVLSIGTQFKKADTQTYEQYNLENLHHFRFKFLHDKVQQAAYMMMDKKSQQRKHLLIARMLMQSYVDGDKEVSIFELADHYQASFELIEAASEKLQVLNHFCIAGRAALASTAYHMALKYLQSGIALTNKEMWESNYYVLFNLYDGEAECLSLIGRFDEAEPKYDALIEVAKTPIEKAELYRKKILQYVNLGRLEEAKKAGFSAMNLLHFKLYSRFRILQIIISQIKVAWKLHNTDLMKIYDTLPEMKDPEMTKAIQVLEPIGIATGLTDTTLALLTLTKTLEEILKHGYTERMPNTLIGLTYMMLSISLRFPQVDTVVKLSEKYLSKIPSPTNQSMYGTIRGTVIDHFVQPAKLGKKYSDNAYQYGLEIGDLLAASIGKAAGYFRSQFIGVPLDELKKEVSSSYKFAIKVQNKGFAPLIHMQNFIVEALLGETEETLEDYREDIQAIDKGIDLAMRGVAHGDMCRYYYLVGQTEKARLEGKIAQKYHLTSKLVSVVAFNKVYYALSLVDGLKRSTKYLKMNYYRLLRLKYQFKAYASANAENFEDKYLLICAEMARLQNKFTEAARLYEEAISKAKNQGFIHIVALAYERAASMYLDEGIASSAKQCIIEAHYYYYRWGCKVKKKYFEEKYPDWLRSSEKRSGSVGGSLGGSIVTTVSANIDLLTVMKSTQAISGEIELEKLLPKIIEIILENAGAQRAIFVNERKNNYYVEIEARVKEGNIIDINSEPDLLSQRKDLPISIIDYVLRSRENVLLDDATKSVDFENDVYIKEFHPKSILCLPIVHHNMLEGVLYLENNLAYGTFTRDRVDILHMLSSQAAISLENARLYRASIRFVPDQFLRLLGKKNIADLNLGDSIEKEMTILFSDIRDYTSIAESMAPKEAASFINHYLSYMAPIIRDNHGFINKYIGDAIMALFPNRPEDGVSAVLAMEKALHLFNKERVEANQIEIDIGIGLHTGPVILCAIGEPSRVDANVLSDATNTASRIESLTKFYGTPYLISDDTLNTLATPERYFHRMVDRVRLKGKKTEVVLYELKMLKGDHQIQRYEQYKVKFDEAFKYYEKAKFKKAIKAFEKCLEIVPEDTVARVFIERCHEYIENGAPDKWDGTYTLLQK